MNGNAIYISTQVGNINFMANSNVIGNIKAERGWAIFTFGKANDDNGESLDRGDATFNMVYNGKFINSGVCDIETWGGQTTLTAANLDFFEGRIGEGDIASTLNLTGNAGFRFLVLGKTATADSVLDGKSTGQVTVGAGVTNHITVQNLVKLSAPWIDNHNTIENDTLVTTTGSFNDGGDDVSIKNQVGGKFLNNTSIVALDGLRNLGEFIGNGTITVGTFIDNKAGGEILSTGTMTVGGKLENAGLIDTAMLVDVTGNIENSGFIQNVVTLHSKTDIVNKTDGVIVNDQTVRANQDVLNNGTIDRFKTLEAVRDIQNTFNGYINVEQASTAIVGRNVFNNGFVVANGTINVANQFTNQNNGWIFGAGRVNTGAGLVNEGLISAGNMFGSGAGKMIDTLNVIGPYINNATGNIMVDIDPSHYPSNPFAGLHNDLIDVVEAGMVNGGEVIVNAPSNDKSVTATPTRYVGNQQDCFTEKGADSLNLVGDITTAHSFRSMLGTRFELAPKTVNRGKLSLYGNAVWMHEFLSRTHTNFTAQFSNPSMSNFSSSATYTVKGNTPNRDWAIVGAGLNYKRNRFRLFGGYDAYVNEQQVLHTGNAGLAYGW